MTKLKCVFCKCILPVASAFVVLFCSTVSVSAAEIVSSGDIIDDSLRYSATLREDISYSYDENLPSFLASNYGATYDIYKYNSNGQYLYLNGSYYIGQTLSTDSNAYHEGCITFTDIDSLLTEAGTLKVSYEMYVYNTDMSQPFRLYVYDSSLNTIYTEMHSLDQNTGVFEYYYDGSTDISCLKILCTTGVSNGGFSMTISDIEFISDSSLEPDATKSILELLRDFFGDSDELDSDNVDSEVNEFESVEGELFDNALNTTSKFTFGQYDLSGIGLGFTNALNFLTLHLNLLFLLTEFSTVFYVIVALTFAVILLGVRRLWRG